MRLARTAAVIAVALTFMTAPAFAHKDKMHHGMSHHTTKHSSHHMKHPHHSCHGMSAGTAHHHCGTRTGGPSGGLH